MVAVDPSPWLAVLGRAHVVLLHAPLGLLPGLALLEFGAALFRRPLPRGAVLALAWLCALAAAAAAASGLLLAGERNDTPTLEQHKIAGLVMAGLCVVAALCAFAARRGPFRVALVLALAAAVPAGHLGGTMTHGTDFLFEPLHPKTPPAPPPLDPSLPTPSPTDFARSIAPILERVCTSCHNPDKLKGELLLTTREGILKGGENGAVVVAGKPDESPLVLRLALPADHDDHMPPAEKPQPTAAEITALRAWIAAGAPF